MSEERTWTGGLPRLSSRIIHDVSPVHRERGVRASGRGVPKMELGMELRPLSVGVDRLSPESEQLASSQRTLGRGDCQAENELQQNQESPDSFPGRNP